MEIEDLKFSWILFRPRVPLSHQPLLPIESAFEPLFAAVGKLLERSLVGTSLTMTAAASFEFPAICSGKHDVTT